VAMNGHISPGLASLVIQVQAFFTIGLAMALTGERVKGFQILALEQTTDEILEALRQLPEAEPIRVAAEPILRLADLVKFAKYQPVAAEHEQAVDGAQEIVQKSSESC